MNHFHLISTDSRRTNISDNENMDLGREPTINTLLSELAKKQPSFPMEHWILEHMLQESKIKTQMQFFSWASTRRLAINDKEVAENSDLDLTE